MLDIKTYWNNSSASIPDDKDVSNYAIEKEKLFPRESVICDLGGGTGADALYFLQKGHQVTLIDVSDLALSKALTTARNLGFEDLIKTKQHDLNTGQLPLQADTYDVVYSRLALHYFRSAILSQLISGIYAALKSNGVAYLTLKSPDDQAEMKYLEETSAKLEDGVFDEDGHIKTRFNIKQLEQILLSADLPKGAFKIRRCIEKLDGRKDKVKSGSTQLLINEIELHK